jgi:putative membrane protein
MTKNFVGIVGTSTFISFPVLAQTNLNSSPPAPAAPGATTTKPSTSLTALDQQFITKAAQSNLTEIQTSQLALQRSKNEASCEKCRLPKDIGPDNKTLLTKLTKATGNNFAHAYMQGQVQGHQKTLAEYQKYLQNGQYPNLKAFARQVAPTVGNHLQLAQRIIAQQ